MTDTERAADKLDGQGEDPAAESGAGYGSHAPDADTGTPDQDGEAAAKAGEAKPA